MRKIVIINHICAHYSIVVDAILKILLKPPLNALRIMKVFVVCCDTNWATEKKELKSIKLSTWWKTFGWEKRRARDEQLERRKKIIADEKMGKRLRNEKKGEKKKNFGINVEFFFVLLLKY